VASVIGESMSMEHCGMTVPDESQSIWGENSVTLPLCLAKILYELA